MEERPWLPEWRLHKGRRLFSKHICAEERDGQTSGCQPSAKQGLSTAELNTAMPFSTLHPTALADILFRFMTKPPNQVLLTELYHGRAPNYNKQRAHIELGMCQHDSAIYIVLTDLIDKMIRQVSHYQPGSAFDLYICLLWCSRK